MESFPLRIAALNSDSSEDESKSLPVTKATTKEAQECEVFSLYNQALSLERQGLKADAKHTLHTVLQQKIVQQTVAEEVDGETIQHQGDGGSRPLLALKYSAYKNLASIYYQEENWDKAIQYYLQAVLVDTSEVSVWYKIGTLALKIHNYALARHAFEQGLLCNSNHWPCLDHVITLMYALGNYQMCLYYISKALARDAGYVKGLVFMKHIYDEMPSIQRGTMHLFSECDSSIYDAEVEEEETEEYVTEAIRIREKRRELSRPPEKPQVDFITPLKHTWQSLGECLIALYDHVQFEWQNTRKISFTCRVKLTPHITSQLSNIPTSVSPVAAVVPMDTDVIVTSIVTEHVTSQASTLATSIVSDMEIDPVTDPGTLSEETAFNKKPGKRKRLWALQEEFGGKRRSTRPRCRNLRSSKDDLMFYQPLKTDIRISEVRNVVHRKQEESINYQELLTKFLPHTLRFGRETDESSSILADVTMDNSMSGNTSINSDNTIPKKDVVHLSATEGTDVVEFLRKHENNGGLLSLMKAYLVTLSRKCMTKWPLSLPDIYISVGEKYRKHLQYPDYLCRDVSNGQIKILAEIGLLLKELKVDKWMKNKTKMASPRKSPGRSFDPDFPGMYFMRDLDYLCGVSCLKDVLQQDGTTFKARVEWVCGKFMLLENKLEMALEHFHTIASHLKSGDSAEVLTLWLPNITHDNLISIAEVLKQVESLERCQSLEEVHRLHEVGRHGRVVELLLQTFTLKQGKPPEDADRMEQLVLLQESLIKLKDYERCIVWSEVSFHEALKRYHSAGSKSSRHEWLTTLTTLMEGINKCIVNCLHVIKHLPSINLMRLTQNLLWLLDVAMDVPDNAIEINIGTPLPWILLYRLIDHEEKLVERDLDELPSAIMLLNFAHECLGRRSWCVSSDGALLLFIAAEFVGLLRSHPADDTHPFKDDLEEAIEQAFYCLYGHPNKRNKAKHLQDHNVPQIELTWERAAILFYCFKPKSMPEYDSYRTSTVSAELENLLKRIVLLIPPQVGLTGNTIESVTSYIEGTSPHPPSLTEDSYIPIVSEIYYLLADYYFKNKEAGKAIKFYLHDLCVNPERFDSWAGMALARSSRLEQRLNSHELKNEPGTIQKQANSALFCFRRALELDSCNSKLWIEYGNLAYQVHSYLSRTLKQHSLFPLTEDALELTKKNKAEMLKVASSCYNKAGECDEDGTEEPWLQHYMCGKIAEKMGEKPEVYLLHYKKAAEYLHEERAKYPKKITYILSPPYLSVEALEVFYRLHVSVIKFLIKNQNLLNSEAQTKGGLTEPIKDVVTSSLTDLKPSHTDVVNKETEVAMDLTSEKRITDKEPSSAEKTSTEVATEKLYLDVLEKYVEESLKTPFALSQEKEKPKVKISERSDTDGPENWSTPVSTVSKVRTPTRASRLDHTYSSMSRRRQLLSDTSQESSPLVFLSNMTPLSSAPSSGLNTPMGSSPRISDMSFATPVSVSIMGKLGTSLPLGITPLAGMATMASSLTTVATTINTLVTTSTSAISTASPAPRRQSLSFSMDSILGITSPSPKRTDESSSPCLSQPQITSSSYLKETMAIKSTNDIIIDLTNTNINQKESKRDEKDQEFIDKKDYLNPPELGSHLEKSPEKINSDIKDKEIRLEVKSLLETVVEKAVELSGGVSPNETSKVKTEVKSELDITVVKCESVKMKTGSDLASTFLSNVEIQNEVKTESESTLSDKNPEKDSDVKIEEETSENPCLKTVKVAQNSDDNHTLDSSKIAENADKKPDLEQMDTSKTASVNKELSDCAEIYRQSVKTPPVSSSSLDVNVSPPKLISPIKPQGSIEGAMPMLEKEMPILEQMDCEKEQDVKEKSGNSDQSDVTNDKNKQSDKLSNESTASSQSEETKQDSQSEKDKETSEKEEKQPQVPLPEWYLRVLKQAMKGLEICLSRFPQHYKSLYRLAQIYYGIELAGLKDKTKSCDLLLGNSSWSDLSHMPCVGLFQERKLTNFFMGLWRIPVEDIDRSGSFATHIAKALWLSLDVLNDLKDYKALYQVHLGLNKMPEPGKKYLRDSERALLARTAYIICFDLIEEKANETTKFSDQEMAKSFLLQVHKYWQHGVRQQIDVKRINGIFTDVYKVARISEGGVTTGASELESAIKYCTQLTAQSKPTPQGTPKMSQSALEMRPSPALNNIPAVGSASYHGGSQTNKSQTGESQLKSTVPDKSSKVPASQSESSQENQLGDLPDPEKLTSDMQEMLGDLASMASNNDILSIFKLTPDELDQFLEDEAEVGVGASEEGTGAKDKGKIKAPERRMSETKKKEDTTTNEDSTTNTELEVIVIDESNIEINFSPKKTSPKSTEDVKQAAESKPEVPGTNLNKEKNIKMILSEVTGQLIPASTTATPGEGDWSKSNSPKDKAESTSMSHSARKDNITTTPKPHSANEDQNESTRQNQSKLNYSGIISGSNITVTVSQDTESSMSENESSDESSQSSHVEAESSDDDVIILSSSD